MVVAVAGNVDHAAVVRQVRRAFVREGFLDGEADAGTPSAQSEKARKVSPGTSRDGPSVRAGQPGARRQRPDPHRPASLRPRRAQHRPRRRHVVAAVPGGPRAPRPGLLRLLLRHPLRRRRRRGRRASAACPASSTRCSRPCAPSSPRWPSDGLTEEELERGKGQLRGGLVLGLEDSGSRMSRIAKAELVYDELLSIDEVRRARSRPSRSTTCTTLARELFTQPEMLAVVGPTTLSSGARPASAAVAAAASRPAPRPRRARRRRPRRG